MAVERNSSRMNSMNDPAEPPFSKHKHYYLFLKIAVLVIAGILGAKYFWGC
jgi:hypothetical protein